MERYRVVRVDDIQDHWIDTVELGEVVEKIGEWRFCNETEKIALFRKESGEIIPLMEDEVTPKEPERSLYPTAESMKTDSKPA